MLKCCFFCCCFSMNPKIYRCFLLLTWFFRVALESLKWLRICNCIPISLNPNTHPRHISSHTCSHLMDTSSAAQSMNLWEEEENLWKWFWGPQGLDTEGYLKYKIAKYLLKYCTEVQLYFTLYFYYMPEGNIALFKLLHLFDSSSY